MTAKRVIDWDALAVHYRAGVRSLKDMGQEFGVSDAAIIKKARREGWTRGSGGSPKSKSARCVQLVKSESKSRSGFVYVIYFDDSAGERFYKIGLSSSFTDRLGTHSCSNPFDVFVACAFFTGDMRSEERYLHARFNDQRVRGEWFQLSDIDLLEISGRSLLI